MSLGGLVRRWRWLLAVNYAYMLEYRAELYLWALAGVLPFLLMGVWMGLSTPLGVGQIARYFLAVFIVRQITIVWVVWEFELHVNEGKLSPLLLQPMDPVWRFVAAHLGEQMARLPFSALLIGLFLWFYPQARWWPKLGDLAGAAVILAATFTLRFLIQYTFSMLCFWTERASALEQLWYMPYLFLSGMVAPLELFPPLARRLAEWTPFPYLVYFPAQWIVGGRPPLLRGLGIMGLWILFFFLLNRWLWRRGLKHFSGMGA